MALCGLVFILLEFHPTGYYKHYFIKKKLKIATTKVKQQLHREPKYLPLRWRVLPNAIINLLAFLISAFLIYTKEKKIKKNILKLIYFY